MASGVQLNVLPSALSSVMAHLNPALEEGGDGPPELLTIDQSALLANVEDDMAALLASIMRRSMGRRVDKPDESQVDDVAERPVDDARGEEVQKIRELLRTAGTSWRVGYNMARALFPDPSELALLLASLRDDVELDEAIRAEIEQSLAELIAEHGEEKLAAGQNIGRVVASFAARTGLSSDGLKKAYHALLHSGSGEALTYRYLIDAFGFSRRGLALDFLEQALAADVAADIPSLTDEAFQPLMAMLFQLRLLRSADALLLATAGRSRKRMPRAQADDQDDDLLDTALVNLLLATLSDLNEAERQFTDFLRQWRVVAGEGHIADWTRRVLRAMAELPVELFPDLAYRQALLTRLTDTVSVQFYRHTTMGSAPWGQHV